MEREALIDGMIRLSRMGLIPNPIEPSPELIGAIKNICQKDARDEALSVLYDKKTEVEISGNQWGAALPGLGGTARKAQYFWRRQEADKNQKSPVALKTEFEELGACMREVAGRLNTLSPTARLYISMMPDYDMASDECRYQMELWNEFNASEAFQSPFLDDETVPVLASRLDGMAKILNSMASEAGKIAEEKPGSKQVFNPVPVDLGLFDSCAWVLVKRGRTLKHLRPIAETLYQFVTGNPPVAYWAKRQEKDARREHETHPQK